MRLAIISNTLTGTNATKTITLLGRKSRLNLRKEIYTKAIYKFVNLEACTVLTMALDAELTF